jgi:hypothetical protein
MFLLRVFNYLSLLFHYTFNYATITKGDKTDYNHDE